MRAGSRRAGSRPGRSMRAGWRRAGSQPSGTPCRPSPIIVWLLSEFGIRAAVAGLGVDERAPGGQVLGRRRVGVALERDGGERQAAERDAMRAGSSASGLASRSRSSSVTGVGVVTTEVPRTCASVTLCTGVPLKFGLALSRACHVSDGRLERDRGKRDAAEAVLVEVRRREADPAERDRRPSGIAAERDRGQRDRGQRDRGEWRRGGSAVCGAANRVDGNVLDRRGRSSCQRARVARDRDRGARDVRVGNRDPVACLSLVAGGIASAIAYIVASMPIGVRDLGRVERRRVRRGPVDAELVERSRLARRRSSGSRLPSRRRCRMRGGGGDRPADNVSGLRRDDGHLRWCGVVVG